MPLSDLKKRLDAAQASSSGARKVPASKPVVVVIDDNTDVLSALRTVLSSSYTVYTSAAPVAGARLVIDAQAQAVILDIRMPIRDGFWVSSEIRKFNATVPVIFNSAFQDAMAHDDAVDSYRPFAFLSKAGGIQELLTTVAAAVRWYNSQPKTGP